MHRRSLALASVTLVSFASLAALLSACVSDDNAGPVVGDAGGFSTGDAGSPPFDATVSSGDASTSDAGSQGDGALPPTGNDAGKPTSDGGALACAPSQRIDLDAGVLAGDAIGSVTNGAQRTALWVSYSAWESDTKAHLRASVFAGGDAGLFDLGYVEEKGNLGFVADQSNHAFAQWIAADGGGVRSVYDFTSFGAPASFATQVNQTSVLALAPLPSGALSLYPNAVGNRYFVDESTGTSAWTPTDGGGGSAASSTRAPALVTNAVGQAVAAWGEASGGGTTTFSFALATFNGKAWSPPFTQTITSDGGANGSPLNIGVVILANGDAKAFFFYDDQVTAQVFSASTQQFVGTPEVVVGPGAEMYFSTPAPNAQDWLTVDANDDVTLVFPRFPAGSADTEIFATRSFAGTWLPIVDVGAGDGNGMHTTLRPGGGVVVVAGSGAGAWISAVGTTGNTWSKPASFQTSRSITDRGAITFDATHVYVVDSQVVIPSQSALGLFVEACDL